MRSMKRVPASGMEWVMRTGPGSGAGSESTLVTASVTVSDSTLVLASVTVSVMEVDHCVGE